MAKALWAPVMAQRALTRRAHGTKQGGAILPDMMRWLWRDHPVSVDVRDTVGWLQQPSAKEEKSKPRGRRTAAHLGGPENFELGHRSNSGR
jgi:hypothetical protein